jgi:hypothetical protein
MHCTCTYTFIPNYLLVLVHMYTFVELSYFFTGLLGEYHWGF